MSKVIKISRDRLTFTIQLSNDRLTKNKGRWIVMNEAKPSDSNTIMSKIKRDIGCKSEDVTELSLAVTQGCIAYNIIKVSDNEDVSTLHDVPQIKNYANILYFMEQFSTREWEEIVLIYKYINTCEEPTDKDHYSFIMEQLEKK